MINFADVIVDLQQGDSGKGKISSHLLSSRGYSCSIRYNGSNNAGHTIYIGGKKIVTHSVPTGVFYGIRSIIGPGCAVNVDHFFSELEEISSIVPDVHKLVKIASNAHIITDRHLEEDGSEARIGTTRRGNGPAYRDKYGRTGIRAESISELKPFITDIYEEFFGKSTNVSVLCEGAQGFYLDIDWGDYPYVTSSHCTVGSAVMNGIPPKKIRKVWGAAKIYETYVGAKKFEPNDPIFSEIRSVGKEYGSTTGRPRQCNWLNLDNLIKAVKINGVTDLVISKMDVLRRVDAWTLIHEGLVMKFDSEDSMKRYISSEISSEVLIHWSESSEKI